MDLPQILGWQSLCVDRRKEAEVCGANKIFFYREQQPRSPLKKALHNRFRILLQKVLQRGWIVNEKRIRLCVLVALMCTEPQDAGEAV